MLPAGLFQHHCRIAEPEGLEGGSHSLTLSPCTKGFRHEACLYGSDDDFLAIVSPFVKEGVAAGEKVILALSHPQAQLVRFTIPEARQATVVPNGERYLRPATTIQALLEALRSHAAQTSARIRVVGSVLDPPSTTWDPWARYEAAVNDIFADFPVWGMCLYDTREVADEVLDEVERTHPYIQRPGEGSVRSSRFEPASTFLNNREPPRPDPIESTTPRTELVNPTAARARHAVVEAGAGSKLAANTIADLILGVSEVVANAHLHGAAPVVLRIWSSHDRIVATVHDCGRGPADPFAGLLPAQPIGEGGGLGLWVTHQICSEVVHDKSPDGFTVRLVVQ